MTILLLEKFASSTFSLSKRQYVNGMLFSFRTEGDPAINDNMHEPGGIHYAKRNKPVSER